MISDEGVFFLDVKAMSQSLQKPPVVEPLKAVSGVSAIYYFV